MKTPGFLKAICGRKTMDEKQVIIYPFSASDDLQTKDQPNIIVYKRYLRSAFKNTRIRNIFVTGGFGVGKSSIIRTFENEYSKESPGRFLYISLGEYREDSFSTDGEPPEEHQASGVLSPPVKGVSIPVDPTEGEEAIKKRQSFLERRILLQIYSCFQKKDLPDSSFRMIPELDTQSVQNASLLLTVCIFTGFLLLNFKTLGELLVGVFGSLLLTPKIMDIVHFGVYCAMIVSFLNLARIVVQRLIPKMRMNAFTIKLDSLEASCEGGACETYIDHYTTEIVYCLQKIADKINYTVVIEDLDRVDDIIFFDIFTRLREINYLINNRLERSGSAKHMRFVYVASDSMVGQLQHTKFADYVLPVFPRLNEATAEMLLTSKLKEAHVDLKKELNDKWMVDDEMYSLRSGIVPIIAPNISNYRLQNAIINEYSLLIQLYHTANPNDNIDTNIAQGVLAVAVYKNLLPIDYSRILSGESAVLPVYCNLQDARMDALFCTLTNRGFLTIQCLYYAGYQRCDAVNAYKKQMKKDLDSTLQERGQRQRGNVDSEFWDALHEYGGEQIKALTNSECRKQCDFKMVASILDFYITNCQKSNRIQDEKSIWQALFSDTISAFDVITILVNCEHLPEDWCKRVDESWNDNGTTSIFDRCEDGTAGFVGKRDMSPKMYRIMQQGLGTNYQNNDSVWVMDNGKRTPKPIAKSRI